MMLGFKGLKVKQKEQIRKNNYVSLTVDMRPNSHSSLLLNHAHIATSSEQGQLENSCCELNKTLL